MVLFPVFLHIQDCFIYKVIAKTQNQIFIILAILRRSLKRVAGSISAVLRVGITVPKKRRSGGEPMSTLCRFD